MREESEFSLPQSDFEDEPRLGKERMGELGEMTESARLEAASCSFSSFGVSDTIEV
jgi:hypothetical protein